MTTGLYHPDEFRDNCGFGLIAHMKGEVSHKLLQTAIESLTCMTHRGGIAADGKTGDGCGLLLQSPKAFLNKAAEAAFGKKPGDLFAVGQVFLAPEEARAAAGRASVEQRLTEQGLEIMGWREVPVDDSCLGPMARDCMPRIEQVFVLPAGKSEKDFAISLFVGRRHAERDMADDSEFYICSLSHRTLAYKGLMMPADLANFYKDLDDPDLQTAICVFHQRFSTNTLPRWPLAQPFRFLSHNGEINTLRGNVNAMNARQALFESELFGDDIKKLLPILTEGASDSAILDNAIELLYFTGRSLPHAMMMLVPEAWEYATEMSEEKRAFYEYHSCLMEPWDGPATLPFSDGRYIGAILDRNGLRPSRYTVTNDGIVMLASETGVLDVDPANVREKGRLQPGKMFLVDLEERRIISDEEIKHRLASRRPYVQWIRENTVHLQDLP